MFSLRNYIANTILLLLLFLTLHINAYSQVINGNFNQPGVIIGSSCHAGTGWSTSSGSNSSQYTNLLGPPTNFWIDITPCWTSGNGTYIEQTVPTVVGNCYYLKFDLGAYCKWDTSDAGVYISIDGNPLGSRIFNDSFDCSANVLLWKTRTSQIFVATATTTTIRFTGEGRKPGGSIGFPGVMGIDNIEMIAGGTGTPAYASIDTAYYCGTGSGIPIKAIGVSPSATIQWSVLNGSAKIKGAGDSVNVTANESSKILMTISDTSSCFGQISDTITIIVSNLKAEINIIDLRICYQDTILFNGSISGSANPGLVKTVWHFGDGNTSTDLSAKHSYTKAGSYTVLLVATDTTTCSDTAKKLINNVTPLQPPYIDIGPSDTTICSGIILELPLGISVRVASYLWQDGSTNPRYYAGEPGKYIVEITNDCGIGYDTITINHKNCSIYFPSAFTPNGDGKNDWAKLLGKAIEDITDYKFSVYNRYGNNVFVTNDVFKGWDGTYNNQEQPVGAYYYYIQYTLDNEKNMLKGDITLVR